MLRSAYLFFVEVLRHSEEVLLLCMDRLLQRLGSHRGYRHVMHVLEVSTAVNVLLVAHALTMLEVPIFKLRHKLPSEFIHHALVLEGLGHLRRRAHLILRHLVLVHETVVL